MTLRLGYTDAGRGRTFHQAHEQEVLEKIPVRRPLTQDEVAETVLFLLSHGARGFNAVEITMDGGMTGAK